eukprot:GILK01001566.1.p1 GENE.GILK01001566.1~~GILK01001566.1.p1  ORF type:complete len:447 (-),score=28.85 GILK01001566.1:7-1347(-)
MGENGKAGKMENTNFEFDVVIVGGGACGLASLRLLLSQGYRCVLIEAVSLGQGQSLHHHGWLHLGSCFAEEEAINSLSANVRSDWMPFLERNGIPLDAENNFLTLPSEVASDYINTLQACGISSQLISKQDLPSSLHSSTLLDKHVSVIRIQDGRMPRKRVLSAIAAGLESHITIGRVEQIQQTASPCASIVRVQLPNDQVISICTKYVVLAAGAGLRSLFKSIHPVDSTHQSTLLKESMKHTSIGLGNYLFIRGPRHLLPPVTLIHEGIMILNQQDVLVDQTVLYVASWSYPNKDIRTGSMEPTIDASGCVEPAAIRSSFAEFLSLMAPSLSESVSMLEFGVFAGYKIDGPNAHCFPYVRPVQGVHNVCLALPGVMTNIFATARLVGELVHQAVSTCIDSQGISMSESIAAACGKDVNVAEEAGPSEWMDWKTFQDRFQIRLRRT